MNYLRRICIMSVNKRVRRVTLQSVARKSTEKMVDCDVEIPKVRSPEYTIPEGIMGQPTYHTHPHMIQHGQLTYGISQAEYVNRRDRLVSKLTTMENEQTKHIVIIPAAVKQFMSEDIPYVFRQNSDFYYFTGCLEPSAVLVLEKPPEKDTYRSTLFLNEKDNHVEQWEGPRTGCSAATKLFAVNQSLPIQKFSSYLERISRKSPTVVWYHKYKSPNTELNGTVQSQLSENSNLKLADPLKAIHSMRVIKSPAEINIMKESCLIGSQSINTAMACTKPGVTESTISAILEFACRQAGAEHLGFPPVVAGGPRATHIHYTNNNQKLLENELLLVDSGSQRWLYNSDISRTWPVSGQFTQHQKILYELVLCVQKRLIELLGEQRQPLNQLFDQMCRLLGQHLQQESILPKSINNNELLTKAFQLCPHHVSHYLGLDIHDSPLVQRHIPMETNMIVTVEPGLYIAPDNKSVPPEFRGIGIRIEDDVLITDDKPEVLTRDCLKEVDEIEAVVGQQNIA